LGTKVEHAWFYIKALARVDSVRSKPRSGDLRLEFDIMNIKSFIALAFDGSDEKEEDVMNANGKTFHNQG
jgi:hypothetical protein